MNVIDFPQIAAERLEAEIIILAHELLHRSEQGRASAHHTAKLARRIAELAEKLAN